MLAVLLEEVFLGALLDGVLLAVLLDGVLLAMLPEGVLLGALLEGALQCILPCCIIWSRKVARGNATKKERQREAMQ